MFQTEEYSQVSQEEDSSSTAARLLPEFVGQVPNVTVQVGREARLPCIIRNLATYRVRIRMREIEIEIERQSEITIEISSSCHHLIEL